MAVVTARNEIDRKLHRIVLESNPNEFVNNISLASFLEDQKLMEFSYSREGKIQYANADTIGYYVSYARTIGLLDDRLGSAKPKMDIRGLENFRQWLSDLVVQYLTEKNCSIEQIRSTVLSLLQSTPSKIPTPKNVNERIPNSPDLLFFKLSLKVISRLRPDVIKVQSRRVILLPKFFVD